jgi:hypothetical protein
MFALLIVVCAVVMVGCPLMRLETGDYLLIDVDTDVNNPDWLDAKVSLATTGFSPNLVELNAGNGAVRTTIDVGDATIEQMSMPTLSPDGTRVAITASFTGQTGGSILIYNLSWGSLTNLTNIADGVGAHGASWLSNSEVVYGMFDETVTDELTNRIVRHNVDTGVSTVIYEDTLATYGGVPTSGETLWRPKVAPGIDRVLVCVSDYDAGGITRRFQSLRD